MKIRKMSDSKFIFMPILFINFEGVIAPSIKHFKFKYLKQNR